MEFFVRGEVRLRERGNFILVDILGFMDKDCVQTYRLEIDPLIASITGRSFVIIVDLQKMTGYSEDVIASISDPGRLRECIDKGYRGTLFIAPESSYEELQTCVSNLPYPASTFFQVVTNFHQAAQIAEQTLHSKSVQGIA